MEETSALLDKVLDVDPWKGVVVYTRRWFMLALLILMAFCSLLCWVQFTDIINLAARYWQVSPDAIVWLNLLYPTLEIPGLLFTVWLLQTKGLRVVLLMCAGLQLVGSWLRYLGSMRNTFWAMFLGQAFFGVAVSAIDSSPTYIANTWFREDQRGTAVAIYVVGLTISLASISVVVPTLVTNFWLLILITAGIVSVSSILNGFIQQDKPPTPPSVAAQAERVSFKDSIISIWKVVPFLILTIFWGCAFGTYQSFLALITPLTQPTYTQEQSGYFLAGVMVSGLIGTITSGLLIDKYRAYRALLLTGVIGFGAIVVALAFLFGPGRFVVLIILFSALGFFGFLTYPTALEMSADLTFPIPEQYSAAILALSTDAWTVGVSYAGGLVFDTYGQQAAWYFMASISALSVIGLFFVRPVYKRMEYEAAQKKPHSGSIQIVEEIETVKS